jgi:hypothetical protein
MENRAIQLVRFSCAPFADATVVTKLGHRNLARMFRRNGRSVGDRDASRKTGILEDH